MRQNLPVSHRISTGRRSSSNSHHPSGPKTFRSQFFWVWPPRIRPPCSCCCVKNTPLPLSTFQNVCTALFLPFLLLLDAGFSCCVLCFLLFVLPWLPLCCCLWCCFVAVVATVFAAAFAAAGKKPNTPFQLLTKCLFCFLLFVLLLILFVLFLLLFFMFVLCAQLASACAAVQQRVVPRRGREGWCPEGWGPGLLGPELGPEGWRFEGPNLEKVWPRRVGGPKFRAFFPLPPLFSFFLRLLGVVSFEFGGVIEGRDPQMCTFGVLGLSCEASAAEGESGEGGAPPKPQNQKKKTVSQKKFLYPKKCIP